MEIFMRGLPSGLTDRSLHSQLEPILNKLSITDYACRINRGKRFGSTTFIDANDGARFLDTYGETRSPYGGRIPRLYLMQQPVSCTISRHQPSAFVLNSIKHEIEKSRSQPRRSDQHGTVSFATRTVHCGHIAYTGSQTQYTFVSEWEHSGICTTKFAKHHLILDLSQLNVMARIPYETVFEMVYSERGRITFTLTAPPVFLKREPGLLERSGRQNKNHHQRLSAIDKDHEKISRLCSVYCVEIPTATVGGSGQNDFISKIGRVKQKDLMYVTPHDIAFQVAGDLGSSFPRKLPHAVAQLKSRLGNSTQTNSLPYGILFLLDALVENGYLHPGVVLVLTEKLLAATKAGKKECPISIDAFKKLFLWIDYPSAQPSNLQQFNAAGIMDYLLEAERKLRVDLGLSPSLLSISDNVVNVFRAVVTPTRVTLHGPDPEAKNRVLRKYPQHTDFFLRAQFCDERGEDLYFNPKISLEPIYDRFKEVLSRGISVAGRVYGFLGFSHSSLRSHSVWLSAPFVYKGKLRFADFIVRGLGTFDGIKSPARRAARIGQAFSETPFSVSLVDHGIRPHRIVDVERYDGRGIKRTFSDGVGTLSPAAVQDMNDALGRSEDSVTCFQVRWAGAKGMLSLDRGLTGRVMCIRKSMEKFSSPDTELLEICDMASKPIPMVLNRQLVKILEDMGAPTTWFTRLQANELKHLRGITATVYNTTTFLKFQSIGECIRLDRVLQRAEEMGADYRREPFLRGAIEALILRELRSLKYKARIPVPKGVTLFGIMDETGFLEEGEVYVSFKQEARCRQKELAVPGPVLVTRSPALDAGDVQRAINVEPPEGHRIRALCNCVVFSQKGDRDLPSQLSGGDLDGDLYNIIWDPEVVQAVKTFPPADYPSIKPREVEEDIQPKHMAEFFVDFMKADRVGVIATRHMILADQRGAGTLDSDCKKLAELHSRAVDFSKNGWPVEMIDLPAADRARPDFLAPGPWIRIQNQADIEINNYLYDDGDDDDPGGPRYQYYPSQKLLGTLYRGVDERKIWDDDVKKGVASDGKAFWETLIAEFRTLVFSKVGPIDWESRSGEVKRIRHAYEDAVYNLMLQWADHPSQPLAELEVFIGYIFNKTGRQTNRQRDRSVKLKDEYDRIATWIMKQMRGPTSGEADFDDHRKAVELCFAALCDGCGYDEGSAKLGDVRSRRAGSSLQSFKIVAVSALFHELKVLDEAMAARGRGGGFVGVRGAGRGSTQGDVNTLTRFLSSLSISKPPSDAFGGMYPQLNR